MAGPRHAELEDARPIRLPVDGEWTAIHSPGSRIPSHGTDMLGQRYAFDLIRLDVRNRRFHRASALRLLTLGVPTSECLGYGELVRAPLDGVVVAAVDGVAERATVHPVMELLRVARTALTFRPTPERVQRLLGNHVILRCGDVYAALAHLQPGSVAVATGQQVHAGDVLGRVGHTGNSTAPHLHVQLMDRADPIGARGVACVFDRYEVWGRDGWQQVERAVPTTDQRIRSVESMGTGG
jgi:hypothetical protein